jgi:hypothetical protein
MGDLPPQRHLILILARNFASRLGIAVMRREPAHMPVTITAGDGVARRIEATAFPLMAHAGELVGAIAFFWEGIPKSAEG